MPNGCDGEALASLGDETSERAARGVHRSPRIVHPAVIGAKPGREIVFGVDELERTVVFPVHESVLRRVTVRFDKPLIQNDLRSVYIEEQIGILLGSRWRFAGADWGPFDFESDGVRLEVKQSAALQSWHHRPGNGSFSIAPKQGRYVGPLFVLDPGRHADIYVFAWHGVTDASADHRDVNQWSYYVCATELLPSDQKSISRPSLERITGSKPGTAAQLPGLVEDLAGPMRERLRARKGAVVESPAAQGSSQVDAAR